MGLAKYRSDVPDDGYVNIEVIKSEVLKYNCPLCKDTGIIRYKEIDEFTDRQWVLWKERKCNCQEKH